MKGKIYNLNNKRAVKCEDVFSHLCDSAEQEARRMNRRKQDYWRNMMSLCIRGAAIGTLIFGVLVAVMLAL